MSKKLGGVVALAIIAAAVWLVFFRHRDAAPVAHQPPSKSTQFKIGSNAPTIPTVEADLDREGPLRLEGQVVDADGQGVGGADVWLGTVPPRQAKTEGDGSFSFDKLVGRAYRLTARSGNNVGGPIEYRLTEKSDPAILTLTAGAALVVTVRGDDKKPIANAEIKSEDERDVATTGPDGTAKLQPINPGWVSVRATASASFIDAFAIHE